MYSAVAFAEKSVNSLYLRLVGLICNNIDLCIALTDNIIDDKVYKFILDFLHAVNDVVPVEVT